MHARTSSSKRRPRISMSAQALQLHISVTGQLLQLKAAMHAHGIDSRASNMGCLVYRRTLRALPPCIMRRLGVMDKLLLQTSYGYHDSRRRTRHSQVSHRR